MLHEQGRTSWTHGMADIESGVRLHYVTAGTGHRTVVLLHGFPQNWWEWHHIIPPLVNAGFRVVAPDYRGAGNSWRPRDGYDKRTWQATYIDCCATISASRTKWHSSATILG